ncbi:MAG: PIN domain-containing protein [Candidatus Omnitrophica bacterium]|nr:PIN domain-containing protein [Candidatus Omnitrophota bacterium]
MRIYIDTSVINGLYAEDAPWIKEATKNFFEIARRNNYTLYVSDFVVVEIERTPNPIRRKKLLNTIRKYRLKKILTTEQAEKLAEIYIKNDIIPHKYLPDALHIAIASVHKISALVSWNFKHIVRHKTRIGANSVNKKCGYIQIDICSPEEVS